MKSKQGPALPAHAPGMKARRNCRGNLCARCIISLAFLLASLFICPPSFTLDFDDTSMSEYDVKALYVYYFARFVEWPAIAFPAPNAPIRIGIIGDTAFASLLADIVKDKTIQEHSIAVTNLKWPADLNSYQILYVASSEQRRFAQIEETVKQQPVLTVTEVDEDARIKGIMNLFIAGGKVQFDVSLARAEKAGLQISSKLLRLAHGYAGINMAKRD